MSAAEPYTYMRDPVPADRVGQCPCCLRNHRASIKGGRLARHGWTEQGRQVGQYGHGFQWGACHGSRLRPLEQTDADAITVLARLEKSIAETQAALAMHASAGADVYHEDSQLRLYDARTTPAQDALVAAVGDALARRGITFTSRPGERTRSFSGGTKLTSQFFNVAVTRGAEDVLLSGQEVSAPGSSFHGNVLRVPSWEQARQATVSHLTDLVRKLTEQHAAITLAVAHHRETESAGQADPHKRGLAVHYKRVWVRSAETSQPGATLAQRTHVVHAYCGAGGRGMRSGPQHVTSSENLAEVTCSRCLKSVAGDEAKRAAKVAKEEAAAARAAGARAKKPAWWRSDEEIQAAYNAAYQAAVASGEIVRGVTSYWWPKCPSCGKRGGSSGDDPRSADPHAAEYAIGCKKCRQAAAKAGKKAPKAAKPNPNPLPAKPVTPALAKDLREEALGLMNAWQRHYEESEGMKDEGSCVLDTGVSVEVLPKGKRKPRTTLIVSNADLGYQSEQPAFFKDVIDRLTEHHPEIAFTYQRGRMD